MMLVRDVGWRVTCHFGPKPSMAGSERVMLGFAKGSAQPTARELQHESFARRPELLELSNINCKQRLIFCGRPDDFSAAGRASRLSRQATRSG